MRGSLKTRLFLMAVALCGATRVTASPPTPWGNGSCAKGKCEKAGRPWISLTFSGDGWSARTVQTVLADLRADLAQRQLDLDLPANRQKASSLPIASIDIAKEGVNAVAIQVDIPEGGATRRLSRITALDAVTNDGRPLAIALTAGELLRVSWVRIALLRAAEIATAAEGARSATQPSTRATPPPSAPESPSEANGSETSPTPAAGIWEEPNRPHDVGPVANAIPAGGAGDFVVSDSPASPEGPAPLNVGMTLEGTWLLAPPLSTHNVPTAKGIGLRGAVTGHRYGVSAGILFPTQASLDVGDATARERRFVFDVGGRAVLRGRYVNLGADLGLLVAYRRIDGMDLARNNGASGVDGGLRGGLVVAFGQSRVAPWIGAAAEVLPFSPAIKFSPGGIAGHSPTVWVGASAGLSARLAGPWWP